MSRNYSVIARALWVGITVGITVGISDVILDTLGVQSTLIKAIVFSIAIYIVLTTIEKYKIYKTKSINVPK